MLSVFEEYSQSNCFLECAIKEAQAKLLRENILPCRLWNLPNINYSAICMGTNVKRFTHFFNTVDFKQTCQQCLPDCSYNQYKHFVTSEKFRPCDEKNFGVSHFCQPKGYQNSGHPNHWIDQAMNQLGVEYFKDNLGISAKRNYGNPYVWRQTKYDLFSDDIAVISFFFPSQRTLKILS